jgi:hypothetical protein
MKDTHGCFVIDGPFKIKRKKVHDRITVNLFSSSFPFMKVYFTTEKENFILLQAPFLLAYNM